VLAVRKRVLGEEEEEEEATDGEDDESEEEGEKGGGLGRGRRRGRGGGRGGASRHVEYRGRSGCITSALEKPGISIASTSAAEPASKRAKQSINRAPEGRSSGAEGEQKESKVVL